MKSDWSKGELLDFNSGEPDWLGPKRPVSPAPSGVSMKSDWSKGELLDFNSGEPDWLGPKRPVSPAPSGISMKSDWSKGELLDFNSGEPDWLGPKRSVSPAPSGVSMRSDWSKGELLDFNSGEPDWLGPKRPVSPAPSGVSMKSDWSKGELLDFNSGEPDWLGPKRPVSPAPSGVSMKSDWSKGELLDFNSGEPDWLGPKRPVSPAPSGVSMKSDWSKGELLDLNSGEPDLHQSQGQGSMVPSRASKKTDHLKDEHSLTKARLSTKDKSSSVPQDDPRDLSPERSPLEPEGPVSPASSSVPQDDSPDLMAEQSPHQSQGAGSTVPSRALNKTDPLKDEHSLTKDKGFKLELTADLKGTIIAKYEKELRKDENDTELYEIEGKNKDEIQTYDALFQNSEKEKTRTVLMTGVAGVGKTFQAKRFMTDWANEKSNKNIDLIVKLDFSELNSRRNEVQSMKDLLSCYLNDNKHPEDYKYDDCKVLFVLDGLEKCELPLDFKNTKKLTDIEERASMDKLLVNLIEGNLLPSAVLWIISQPSGVEKIPRDYIQKVTECRARLSTKDKSSSVPRDDVRDLSPDRSPLEPKGPVSPASSSVPQDDSPDLMAEQSPHQSQGAGSMVPSRASKKTDHLKDEHSLTKDKGFKLEPTADLKGTIIAKYEEELRKDENDTELYEIEGKNKDEIQTYDALFQNSEKEKTRTVLMKGVAGVGKTFQAKRFMLDWAKEKSNKNIDLIVSFDFSELNSRRNEVQSMKDLLCRYLNDNKHPEDYKYDDCKVLFVLDGLEKCELPLDFKNTKKLTDIGKRTSMDKLLVNLIEGNLLPSAVLWIISQPSGVEKIPRDYIHKVTECRACLSTKDKSSSVPQDDVRDLMAEQSPHQSQGAGSMVPSRASKKTDHLKDEHSLTKGKPDVASQQNLKTQLQEQFAYVSEGIDKQKASALLNDIYTDLYIIEGERGEVNDQHEARQIQDAKFKPLTQETSIKYHDIFKPASGENKPIRTVLTIGVAGIGKSFTTMKYMLDWAEGAANEDIFYMFPISFRELNLIKGKEQSLEELINIFFPDMETSEITDYDKYRILIVLDGFDECRLDLDFKESNHCTDVTKQTSVEVLLTNLIKGNLLSKAQIWITSRPAASNHIPSGAVDRVTEVRGFNDDQKEEYFRKRFRFSDKDLAEKILSHVKQSRSLFIMCHIPVFCWITSTVLEDLVSGEKEMMMPKTLTDMYIHFLLLQCRQANVKYGEDETGESTETDSCWNSRNQETVISLGKLAFKGLEEANLLFTEENLTECGVDITNTAVFSGLFTQIKREGPGVSLQKLFCFVHLSIQEFLAALYVFYTFINKGENLLNKSASTAADLYKTAVDKALDSQNGDWDLFLRFLLGLSLDTNQSLLQELLKKTEKKKETNKATIDYIKEKIRDEKSDADKNINLFHCLNELNDQSLVREVKKYLHSETVTFENFSASQWSALTFVLLTSDENLDVFDLKKYLKSEEVLLGMLPVVKVSKTALLSWCELSEKSCKGLSSSVLSSASSNLAKLDLSHNDLLDSGVEKLAEGLKSLHCKLEILKLSGCQVTEKGCSFLASALDSKTASSLKQLDLSYNHPGANGQRMLSDVVRDRNMSLELCFDHGGEHRLKPGLKKYGADLKLDENTASRRLVLSDGYRKAKTFQRVEERAKRPKNEDRFKRSQVICEEGQRGLCYWEVEWKGDGVGIAVTYRGVGRRWDRTGGLGCNEKSWSLLCSKTGYTAIHGKVSKSIKVDPCQKIGVFLDWEGGTLTYYSITSGKLSPIHTFKAKFTEPVFPGFWFKKGSATLCEID
ncbi:uncharacterized protein ABDE67_007627 [Symphorus nematophorus]